MNKALKIVGGILLLLALAGAYLWTFERPSHSIPTKLPAVVAPTGDKIIDALRRGVEYLKVHQEADGHFSRGMLDPKPGFTALIVDALARSPEKYREREPFMLKAVQAILARQHDDGGFYTSGFGVDTYTTAIGVMALTSLENPAHAEAVKRAKDYLLSVQHLEDDEEKNQYYGGAGYGKGGRASGDLTVQWIEALKAAGVKEGDPAFKNAEKFLSRLQNNEETNQMAAPGTEVGTDGGFFYRPGESKAKDAVGKNGKRIISSYGLMSYRGLQSFLYMAVSKDDPRVQSAYRWVKNNYTLEENRNIGQDGLYYYYLAMAKALAAYGDHEIVTSDGVKHDWAQELSDKLISLQDVDGSWHNKGSSQWMEDDAVMVTAFAIRTLTICHEELKKK